MAENSIESFDSGSDAGSDFNSELAAAFEKAASKEPDNLTSETEHVEEKESQKQEPGTDSKDEPAENQDKTEEQDPDEEPEQSEEPADKGKEDTEKPTPPDSWRKDAKELFETLPKEVQAEISRRAKAADVGYEKKFNELAQVKNQLDQQLNQAAPFTQAMQLLQNGTQQQKQNFILSLADSFAVPLTQSEEQEGTENPQKLNIALQEIQSLKEQLNSFQQTQQQNQNAALVQQIQSFAGQKDESGRLLRPHFQEVRQTMSRLLTSGLATSLEDAYEKSVSLNPELREKMPPKGEQSSAERALQAMKNRQAKRAKNANISGNSKRTPVKKYSSFEEEMRDLLTQ